MTETASVPRGRWLKTLEPLAARRSLGEVIGDFGVMAACALTIGVTGQGIGPLREEEYLQVVGRYKRDEVKVFPEALAHLQAEMEVRPFEDLVGVAWLEHSSQSQKRGRGEFYTPPEVTRMMAEMQAPDTLPEDRAISVLEPAAGAGQMILSFAEVLVRRGYSPLNMRATCVELAYTSANICFLNLSLWGIPAQVVWGNGLTFPHEVQAQATWRTLAWPLAHPGRKAEGGAVATDQAPPVPHPRQHAEQNPAPQLPVAVAELKQLAGQPHRDRREHAPSLQPNLFDFTLEPATKASGED